MYYALLFSIYFQTVFKYSVDCASVGGECELIDSYKLKTAVLASVRYRGGILLLYTLNKETVSLEHSTSELDDTKSKVQFVSEELDEFAIIPVA